MVKYICLILTISFLIKASNACDANISSSNSDEIAIWLGEKSIFSKAYRSGKCVLDKALIDIPVEQKKVIANLIAKSYFEQEKKNKEVLIYNY